MSKKKYATVVFVMMTLISLAQNPHAHWTETIDIRYNATQPIVNYSLTVDSSDFSSFTVEMNIRNLPDTFRVAMVAHPEYDDRYWRYVEDLSVETRTGKGKVIREDSSLWKIITNNGEAVLHYRIHLPAIEGNRSSWKAYLTATGGLVGGPHSFMYVVGATLIPSYITLHIPSTWEIATGLQSTTAPKTFFAASVFSLTDDPIFIGQFKTWSFTVDHTPHRLIYWPLPDAKPFDENLLVSSVQKLVQQTALLFGRLPYRDYTFIIQDGAIGSLEHNNSVTVGAPSAQLANGITAAISEIAHEYFHTWNLVRIHPIEYRDVDHKTPSLSKGLWFSEGWTIYYADLLLRRAGLPVFDSTRLFHLQNLIRRYSANPAYSKFNAEQISLAAYAPTGMLGDYSASTHLQGEVFATLLDLAIRDASNGQRSMDDVMIKMMERFSARKGFTSNDVGKTISDVCGCDVRPFFRDHVFGNKPLDLKKYLRLAGLDYTSEWKDVLDNSGKPVPDLRVFAYQLPNESHIRVGITNPSSAWGKAGLHTGEVIKTFNGKPIVSPLDLRTFLRNVKLGDTVSMEIVRRTETIKINVPIVGYQQPVIDLRPVPGQTAKQRQLFEQWAAGK